MKHTFKPIIIFLILTISFTSCEPVEYGEIGDPFSKLEAIEGTWIATEVIQIDETALAQGGLYTEMDLTNLFNFTSYSITFNLDGEMQSSTFSVNDGGAPSFIDSTGTWAFNNSEFPDEIYFTLPDSLGYTSKLKLIAPPRDQNPLRMKFQRFSGEKLIVSYRYNFEKQTQ